MFTIHFLSENVYKLVDYIPLCQILNLNKKEFDLTVRSCIIIKKISWCVLGWFGVFRRTPLSRPTSSLLEYGLGNKRTPNIFFLVLIIFKL